MPQTEISTAGRWTVEEHEKFLLGLQLFGKNWKKIEEIIGTRNGAQIRSHAQKYFLKLRKEDISSEKEQDNSAPIQRSIVIQNKEESSDCSYFMGKILEFARYHENVDIWDALIDSGSHKETATETEFCNDCLHQQKDQAQFQENFQKDITR